ncbi:MAG TPA: zinc metallopeptidase [Lachnospiraceae bacterium]|nr:zinc metallopeptidase [Lachnospiraceae bacterium]
MWPYYYYFDPTYILVLIGAVICIIASGYVNSAMKKYHGVRNARGLTGGQAAEQILMQQGIYDVRVECLQKGSGDHYDPASKTLRLSYENFNYATVTSVAVAAHECGHAAQHQEGYALLTFRTALVPVVNIGSFIGFPLIILGVFLSWNQVLIQIGIWAFALAVLFQLITLPVEFNASRRGLQSIEVNGLLGTEESKGAKKVLSAAAMTYVAAAASSILQLLRLLLLFGGNRRRD